jgi:chromosome segregation ATPase
MTTLEWLMARLNEASGNSAIVGGTGAAVAWIAERLRQVHVARRSSQIENRKQTEEEKDAAFRRLNQVVEVLQEDVTDLRQASKEDRARANESEQALALARTDLRRAIEVAEGLKAEVEGLRRELARERTRATEADDALQRARAELRQASHDLRDANGTIAALRNRLGIPALEEAADQVPSATIALTFDPSPTA